MTEQETADQDAAIEAAVAAAIPATDVRKSPEYLELVKAKRTAESEARKARGEAEKNRIALEGFTTAQQTAQQAAIEAALGPDGIAEFNQLVEASETDPMAAAKLFAEMRARVAQSAGAASTEAAGSAGETGEANVGEAAAAAADAAATISAPATPPRLEGAPLGSTSTGEDIAAIIKASEDEYTSVVKRNLDGSQRNRVTMRERGKAFMAYLAGSYLKAGAKPAKPPSGS